MKFKVPQEHLEFSVVVVQGSAFRVGDVNGEDAVVVVGLHDAAIRPEEGELLAGLELLLGDLRKVAHDDAPLFEVPVGEQDTSSFEITTTPGQYKGACA